MIIINNKKKIFFVKKKKFIKLIFVFFNKKKDGKKIRIVNSFNIILFSISLFIEAKYIIIIKIPPEYKIKIKKIIQVLVKKKEIIKL